LPLKQTAKELLYPCIIRFSDNTALSYLQLDLLDLPDFTNCIIRGRYALERRIRGSKTSALYQGLDKSSGHRVAVKLLSPYLAMYPGYLEEFQTRAKVASKLRNGPNIAYILESDTATLKVGSSPELSVPYVCTDFMEQGSLESRIAELKFQKPKQVEDWLLPIAQALKYAHDLNCIHGGLKPSSIVFDGHGKPFLTDFAVVQHSGTVRSSTVYGAPDFMSPEQWDDSCPSNALIDQYSLAALVYFSLTGVPPYERQSDPGVRRRNLERGPLPVHEEAFRSGNENILPGVSTVLSRALAVRPEKRFSSIDDFCSAFSQASSEALVRSGGPSVFLSYRRAVAGGWVMFVKNELERLNISVFMDVNGQDTAGRFPDRIKKEISQCDVFVCFLSKTTLTSAWVRKEIEFAFKCGKPAIPIFDEDFRPPKSAVDLGPAISELLNSQAVRLLTRKNLYPDKAIDILAKLIHDALSQPKNRKLRRPVRDP
jgi:serine/threonine protein kinase